VMTDETISRLAETNTPLVPTLLLLANLADFGQLAGVSRASRDRLRRVLDTTAETLHRSHSAGVTLVAGTDTGFATTPYGEWHAREIELLQAYAGLTSMEALRTATCNAAATVGLEGEVGVIQEGALADLLVLTADPTGDVRVLQRADAFEMIVKDGEEVDLATDGRRWRNDSALYQATHALTREYVAGDSADDATPGDLRGLKERHLQERASEDRDEQQQLLHDLGRVTEPSATLD
jgi:hypothetical protein